MTRSAASKSPAAGTQSGSLKTGTIDVRDRAVATATPEGVEEGRHDPARLYAGIVDRYARLFERPEVRLRFLNRALGRLGTSQSDLNRLLRFTPFIRKISIYDRLLEARCYQIVGDELRAFESALTPQQRREAHALPLPLLVRLYDHLYHSRHALYGVMVALAGLLLILLYNLAGWTARYVNGYLAQRYQRSRAPIVVTTAGQGGAATLAAAGAKFLPGYKPEKIWLVEKSAEFERYSNGARISTRYETDNHPRGYYLIPRGSDSDGEQLRREVVGIIYHTSESDIVPFTSENNQSIRYRSQSLLEYVQRNKKYNYMIDRYGEIHRIVRDDQAAFHAGHSIWADDRFDYVGLNESFLGICFESTSEAGSLEETLTEAQIVSGRALTNVLRSQHNIDDLNCTTHGLVSVNPEQMLIAYHHDWVRNFPFEAMGLSDKYKVQPASMIDYGFRYDEEILRKLGNTIWPGALAAEEDFQKQVGRVRSGSEQLRRGLRDRYLRQMEKARQLRTPSTRDDAPLSEAESNR